MKKKTLLFIVALLFICTTLYTIITYEEFCYEWHVNMYVEDENPLGLKLIVKPFRENKKMRITYGEGYLLEYWNGSSWDFYVHDDGHHAVHDILYHFQSYYIGDEFELEWSKRYGLLPSGKYRISKEFRASIYNENEEEFKEEKTFYAEFEIKEY